MPKSAKHLSLHEAADKIMATLNAEKAGGSVARRVSPGHGVGQWLADALGIPPNLAVAGGPHAYAAMSALQQARDAGGGAVRQQHLEQAQRHIARLDPSHHGQLMQHLQGCVVALGGRGGDTELVHATPGEIVIPEWMQVPEVMEVLRSMAIAAGMDPARIVVGSGRNSVNPRTGLEEFDDDVEPPPPYTDGDGNPIEGLTVETPRNPPPAGGDAATMPKTNDPCAEMPALIARRDRLKQEIANIEKDSIYVGGASGIGGVIGRAAGRVVAPAMAGTYFLLTRELAEVERKLSELEAKCPRD